MIKYSVLILVLSVVLSFIYAFNKEINEKKNWAAVQAVEFQYSNPYWLIVRNPSDRPITLLGIKTLDVQSPFVWIILNREGDVIPMPQDVKFNLKCNEIKNIEESSTMSKDVKSFLKSKCTI